MVRDVLNGVEAGHEDIYPASAAEVFGKSFLPQLASLCTLPTIRGGASGKLNNWKTNACYDNENRLLLQTTLSLLSSTLLPFLLLSFLDALNNLLGCLDQFLEPFVFTLQLGVELSDFGTLILHHRVSHSLAISFSTTVDDVQSSLAFHLVLIR